MLKIKNLKSSIGEKEILKGINLNVNPGEIHAVMGRNGSGKSTLANMIAGKETARITAGSIVYKGDDLNEKTPEERAMEGIFLSFQYPVVIPGVNITYFLKEAVNAKRRYFGKNELDAASFLKRIKEKLELVDLDESFIKRSLNEGFSGGEKKRNEILQMLMLEPELAILDETDSGLDIDALKTIAQGIRTYKSPQRSFIIITHYPRLLNYVKPDRVHILIEGKIVKSGGPDLATMLEEKGYTWIEKK
jgi:Fe-S cluster assembly ATP-binding protein